MAVKYLATGLLVLSWQLCGVSLNDVVRPGQYQYQDIVVNGEVVYQGKRDCATRYSIIQEFLSQYKRPFTVLDIGANKGYFSLRAAHEFSHGTFVMVEGDNSEYPGTAQQLLNLCRLNTQLDNIVYLRKQVAPNDLIRLSECEHFDVTFAFNIFHHFKNGRWKEVVDAVLDCSDYVIVENPPQEAVASARSNALRKKVEDYLYSQGGELLAKVKRHTSDTYSSMILVSRSRGCLKRPVWFKAIEKQENYLITSDFGAKKIKKIVKYPQSHFETVDWVRGINLVTFKMMGGEYPEVQTLKQAIADLASVKTNDWVVSNMILQGSRLELIDRQEHNAFGKAIIPFSPTRLERSLHWVALKNPQSVEQVYWNSLVR